MVTKMKNTNRNTDDPRTASSTSSPSSRRYESHLAQSAFEAIRAHGREIIVIRFTKRTTGKKRTMRCMYFPQKADRATYDYDVVGKSLCPVLDTDDGKPKTIPLDTVEWIKVGGKRIWPERELPSTLEEANREMEALFGY